jgi:hypothetical protein
VGGVHRQRRPRRPLPGMLVHQEGSRHHWFQDQRWYDLVETVVFYRIFLQDFPHF